MRLEIERLSNRHPFEVYQSLFNSQTLNNIAPFIDCNCTNKTFHNRNSNNQAIGNSKGDHRYLKAHSLQALERCRHRQHMFATDAEVTTQLLTCNEGNAIMINQKHCSEEQ